MISDSLQLQTFTNITASGDISASGRIDSKDGFFKNGVEVTGGGEFKVGTGVTMASTSGQTFFTEQVTFTGDNYDIKFLPSSNCIRWPDNAQAQWGTGQDLRQYHDGSNGNINVLTGDLIFKWNSQESLRLGRDRRILLGMFGARSTQAT